MRASLSGPLLPPGTGMPMMSDHTETLSVGSILIVIKHVTGISRTKVLIKFVNDFL